MQGDIVAEITWIDGLGNVHKDSRDSAAGKALVGGLGVAGLVTELLLQLQPPSHTTIGTRYKQHDTKLYNDVLDMLQVRMRLPATRIPYHTRLILMRVPETVCLLQAFLSVVL